MKYYIIAGEASGDLHGSRLICELKKEDPTAVIRFWGGDKMARQGGTLVKHYKDLAFMGFWEVMLHLRTILGNISFCKKDILEFQPDVIIYIDYPGFNMRIASWAKKQGFRNHFYISPQIWAWKENRIKRIKQDLDALYVILPFEEAYFKENHNYSVHYVGHPLIEVIQNEKKNQEVFSRQNNKPIIALLPGSRKQEINKMMPVFLKVIQHFPQFQFVVAGAPGIPSNWYDKFIIHPDVSLVHNQTYALLKNSFIAIVTSGTATLETALFNIPQMVCYRSSALSYAIGKRIIKLKYISLVNLIMDEEVVKELIQENCSVESIKAEIDQLSSEEVRAKIHDNYHKLELKLGNQKASEKVAKSIVSSIK